MLHRTYLTSCMPRHAVNATVFSLYTRDLEQSFLFVQAVSIHTSFAAMAMSAESLVKNAAQTEKTLVAKDFAHLNNLSSSVTLHQDAFTLNKDIEGEEAVRKYLAAYFEKYDYTHETLGYAVNEKSKASFALAVDKVCTQFSRLEILLLYMQCTSTCDKAMLSTWLIEVSLHCTISTSTMSRPHNHA